MEVNSKVLEPRSGNLEVYLKVFRTGNQKDNNHFNYLSKNLSIMLSLDRYFENQFDDKSISRQALRKFTEDHIKRLSAQNAGGQYDALLNAIDSAYQGYFGGITDKAVNLALQESRTRTMQFAMENFRNMASRREGLVRSFYSKESAEYQEFYPLGIREYTFCTLENVETLMIRLGTAFNNHKAELGAQPASEFNDIHTEFVKARGNQLTQKGMVADANKDIVESRTPLEEQLTLNLLGLASKNVGKPEMAAVFFDQRILTLPVNKDNDKLGRIAVKATDKVSKNPLGNVKLHFVDAKIDNAETEEDGTAISNLMDIGPRTVRAEKFGYKPFEVTIDVADKGNTTLALEMEVA